ncbi:MAG TPA: hypothetical protein VIN08_16750 [Ohtaekwangia sp.]|uniref:hypothetical protein n=1 Tax=Ohtaekwangia sp. TaxID=2066019 RepID=UPI002F91DA8D
MSIKSLTFARVLAFISILLLIPLLESCTSFVEKKRRVLIVLLDYSASNTDLVLESYISVITETIFPNMKQYDCLVVVPIDEGSKMRPVKLVYEDLVEKQFSRRTDGFAHAGDSLKKRFMNYVKETAPQIAATLKTQKQLRREYTEYTDILGAIHQTTNLIEFNTEGGTVRDAEDFVLGKIRLKSENIIVLLSDMIQDSREYNFNKKQGITPEQATTCLDGLKKTNGIPDLTGCKVFAIGATGRNSAQIDNIHSFWTEYFKHTNAELSSYGYNVDGKLRKYLIATD